MSPGISVVICCYNSERLIEETLAFLRKQVTNQLLHWEIILVDNNCTDQTVEKAQSTWSTTQPEIPLHVIKEAKPGQMMARIAGVNFAHYDYVVFCDDDNHLQENYLEKAYALMRADEQIGIIGGVTEGKFETSPPEWFEVVKSAYAVGTQGDLTGDITHSRGHVWGAGMAGRTVVLRKVLQNGFISLGRKGKGLASGDDTELCYRVVREGFKIIYSPELQLAHFITQKRLLWSYAVELNKGQTIAVIKLSDLRRAAVEQKEPITVSKRYRDFVYLFRKLLLPSKLFRLRQAMRLKKNEGNIDLWRRYFDFYYAYSFFKIKILGSTN